MNFEEKNENFASKKNDEGTLVGSSAQRKLATKTLEECLLDSTQQADELFYLYDSVGQSFLDFEDIINTYRDRLKVLKEKRFHVRKPLSMYRLEEHIDIFESFIDIYKRSFKKIDKDIKGALNFFYGKKIPGDENKKIEEREAYFANLYKEAMDELKKRKSFYQKIEETKK